MNHYEESKEEALDRQLNAVVAGQSSVVICPWCGIVNDGTKSDCCIAFTVAKDERGKAQFTLFMLRFGACVAGKSAAIECPYCGSQNYPPDANVSSSGGRHPAEWKRPGQSPFCCDLFQEAAIALAQKQLWQQKIDQYNRINDGVTKASVN